MPTAGWALSFAMAAVWHSAAVETDDARACIFLIPCEPFQKWLAGIILPRFAVARKKQIALALRRELNDDALKSRRPHDKQAALMRDDDPC
jgi:hypothetical protein